MTSFLLRYSELSPLETLAEAFARYDAIDAARRLFDAYEDFLQILDNKDDRKRLKALKVSEALSDTLFIRAKKAALDFQTALTQLFFETNRDLTSAAQTYGVF